LDVRSHDRITAGGGGRFFSPKDFPGRAFGLGPARVRETDLWWPGLFSIKPNDRRTYIYIYIYIYFSLRRRTLGETSEGIEGIRPGSIPSKASGTKEFLLRREPV
jgi:hypothetical protein